MDDNRSKLFLTVNAFVPLCLGLVFYLTCQRDTFIRSIAERVGFSAIRIGYPSFVDDHACDLLWGYALAGTLCLVQALVFGTDIRKWEGLRLKGIVILSVLLSAVMEILQKIGVFPGVFDPVDIICETIAIIICAMVIKHYFGRAQDE